MDLIEMEPDSDDERYFKSTEEEQDLELDAIKTKLRQMEKESKKWRSIQEEMQRKMKKKFYDKRVEADRRSVYVGNVDYDATAVDLHELFEGFAGSVRRITILTNKTTGHPKGYAFIEFEDQDSASLALALDETVFHGRQIKVLPKRTNKPGIITTRYTFLRYKSRYAPY